MIDSQKLRDTMDMYLIIDNIMSNWFQKLFGSKKEAEITAPEEKPAVAAPAPEPEIVAPTPEVPLESAPAAPIAETPAVPTPETPIATEPEAPVDGLAQ